MSREPDGDAYLTNADVDHAASIIANLKARLDEAERSKASMMIALVQGAGGRIQVDAQIARDLPRYEVIQTIFQQTGDMVFETRRKLP